MDDILNKPEFQRILEEAAHYRTLRQVFRELDRDGDNRFVPKRDDKGVRDR